MEKKKLIYIPQKKSFMRQISLWKLHIIVWERYIKNLFKREKYPKNARKYNILQNAITSLIFNRGNDIKINISIIYVKLKPEIDVF